VVSTLELILVSVFLVSTVEILFYFFRGAGSSCPSVLFFWLHWGSSKSLADGIDLAFELLSAGKDCAFNQVLDGQGFP
jgi:hypothetical protein